MQSAARCTDNEFGPIVQGCRGGFDFTLLFEQSILSILPAVLFVLFSIRKILTLRRQPILVCGSELAIFKLLAIGIYGTSQFGLVILWLSKPAPETDGLNTSCAVIACAFSLFDAAVAAVLSFLEHFKNPRPSTTIVLYFLFSATLDAAQLRTLWLLTPLSALTCLFAASVGLKLIIVVLESIEKDDHFLKQGRFRSPEETSGILNRSILFWLYPLLRKGFRERLCLDDLFELDSSLTSDQIGASFLASWAKVRYSDGGNIAEAIARHLGCNLSLAVLPRLALLMLTLCQPLILNDLLFFLDADIESPVNAGYWLIVAYGLVFFGMAISAGIYWQLQFRCLVKLRGCIVSAISWKLARLNITAISQSNIAVTLMSTDVEVVYAGCIHVHEVWASMIQVGVGTYILGLHTGLACLLPLVMAFACFGGTTWINRTAGTRQTVWMEAIQIRIGIISGMLSSRKSQKLRGLDALLRSLIQRSRTTEIRKANNFRHVWIWASILGFTQQFISPVITFLFFLLEAKKNAGTFDASKAFTSIATLLLITQPAGELIKLLPSLQATFASLRRVDEFMKGEERVDFRKLAGVPRRGGWKSFAAVYSQKDGDIELNHRDASDVSCLPDEDQVIIRVQNGRFGWNRKQSVLSLADVSFPRDQLTCVFGPTASGKSTLCKTILGETYALQGRVELFTPCKDVAFCDQTPSLQNKTIRENIVQASPFDSAWYSTVVEACALSPDLIALADGDQTSIGSSGERLSGGQKQRVALARALYHRKPIMVLDDVLSSQDAQTALHIFQNAIGPRGAAQKNGVTVILATSSIKYLPFADHILVLSPGGEVSLQGSFKNLRDEMENLKELSVQLDPNSVCEGQSLRNKEHEATEVAKGSESQPEEAQPKSDWTTYWFYLSAAGLWTSVLFLLFGMSYAGFLSLSTLWLAVWTDTPSGSISPSDWFFVSVYAIFRILALASLGLFSYYGSVKMATRAGLRLHSRTLEAVLNAPFSHFSNTDVGVLTSRFSQDMMLLDIELPLGFQGLASCLLAAFGQVILVTISTPWAGLIFPIIVGSLYRVQHFYVRTSRQLRLLDLETTSGLYTHYQETLNGLCTFRSFGWEISNIKAACKLLDNSQRPLYLLAMTRRWLCLVVDVAVALLAVVIVSISVTLRATAGSAGVALVQVLSMSLLLSAVMFNWAAVETTMSAIARIQTFTRDTPAEDVEGQDPPSDWPTTGKIDFMNVTAGYVSTSHLPVLQQISFSVHGGEKIGICGRSGSGKSSLILALASMLEIECGSIAIDGLRLSFLSRHALRSKLNIIPQEPAFIPGSIRFNLDPLNKFSQSRLEYALEQVKLLEFVNANGGLEAEFDSSKLSQGQRQLFCLATAMLCDAKVVALDEATSRQVHDSVLKCREDSAMLTLVWCLSVDDKTDKIMQDFIREHFRNCTVLAVAHRLDTIIDFDKIAVLHEGKLCEFDTPQALRAQDSRFAAMLRAQDL